MSGGQTSFIPQEFVLDFKRSACFVDLRYQEVRPSQHRFIHPPPLPGGGPWRNPASASGAATAEGDTPQALVVPTWVPPPPPPPVWLAPTPVTLGTTTGSMTTPAAMLPSFGLQTTQVRPSLVSMASPSPEGQAALISQSASTQGVLAQNQVAMQRPSIASGWRCRGGGQPRRHPLRLRGAGSLARTEWGAGARYTFCEWSLA